MKSMENKVPKVFLDTNILIDYLVFRGDEAMAAEYLFECSLNGAIDLHIAAHSLTNIFYILRKDCSAEERQQIVFNLCALCNVGSISSERIEKAVSSGYTADLEDALQIQCAVDSGCDYFVTRDFEFFENSPVKTVLPHSLIQELSL